MGKDQKKAEQFCRYWQAINEIQKNLQFGNGYLNNSEDNRVIKNLCGAVAVFTKGKNLEEIDNSIDPEVIEFFLRDCLKKANAYDSFVKPIVYTSLLLKTIKISSENLSKIMCDTLIDLYIQEFKSNKTNIFFYQEIDILLIYGGYFDRDKNNYLLLIKNNLQKPNEYNEIKFTIEYDEKDQIIEFLADKKEYIINQLTKICPSVKGISLEISGRRSSLFINNPLDFNLLSIYEHLGTLNDLSSINTLSLEQLNHYTHHFLILLTKLIIKSKTNDKWKSKVGQLIQLRNELISGNKNFPYLRNMIKNKEDGKFIYKPSREDDDNPEERENIVIHKKALTLISKNSKSRLSRLLKKQENTNLFKDMFENKLYPLHQAILHGKYKSAEVIAKHMSEQDIEQKNRSGMVALEYFSLGKLYKHHPLAIIIAQKTSAHKLTKKIFDQEMSTIGKIFFIDRKSHRISTILLTRKLLNENIISEGKARSIIQRYLQTKGLILREKENHYCLDYEKLAKIMRQEETAITEKKEKRTKLAKEIKSNVTKAYTLFPRTSISFNGVKDVLDFYINYKKQVIPIINNTKTQLKSGNIEKTDYNHIINQQKLEEGEILKELNNEVKKNNFSKEDAAKLLSQYTDEVQTLLRNHIPLFKSIKNDPKQSALVSNSILNNSKGQEGQEKPTTPDFKST